MPKVDASASVHEFSLLEGDVSVAPGAMVSPGTAITADKGASVVVSDRCHLLPGVVVEALAGAQVMGDRSPCSIYLGLGSVIAHKSLIHSPAFVGAGCFVGFRSTIFNARLGEGCVVMTHALVQDVEIPPGRCVPAGSIITSQHQADQLPQVKSEDIEFAKEIMGASAYSSTTHAASRSALGSGQKLSGNGSSYGAISRPSGARLVPVHSSSSSSYATEGAAMPTQTQRLSPEIVQQVRQYLAQGYRVGMEHADNRRYRSGVWETCTPIKDTREQAVFAALENCLAEHTGEYVRMFGIDPRVKRRVGMVTVQRPDGKSVSIGVKPLSGASSAGANSNGSGSYGSNNGYAASSQGGSASGLAPEIKQEVSNLLRAGYIIGTEHADARRFRSNVWKSCSPINSTNEQEVFSRLQHCLEEHAGEYVRMFGIDPRAKRRVAALTIQRADGKPVEVSGRPVAAAATGGAAASSSYGGASYSASNSGGGAAIEAAGQILRQGGQIGVEFADARRYRSGIWQTAPKLRSVGELQQFLSQNADKYVRIFSVNPVQKTRGASTTIQKPGQSPASQSGGSQGTTSGSGSSDDSAFINAGDGKNSAMGSDVMNQVTQLVSQGFRISIEYADKRRYRSGIWQTGPSIEARRPAEAISALGKQLAQHQGSYVRLIGTDPQAKRRVLESTIQRP
ncbi:MAG: ribulose bisphosphate carboxylase small subunit [Cyanobacteria bacterium J06632_3]